MPKLKPSKKELEQIFQTKGASPSAIRRWKSSWKKTSGRVKVKSYSAGIKLAMELDIDPLYYQFFSEPDGDYHEVTYLVFFNPEHEVLFKLHH